MNDEAPAPPTPDTPQPPGTPHRPSILVLTAAILLVGGIITAAWGITHHKRSSPNYTATTTNSTAPPQKPTITDDGTLHLNPAANYGNKYADGILPVGDNRYTTSGARKGYVYVCRANFVPASQAGAQVRGPWFVNNNTQWDINKKAAVQGSITWDQQITINVNGGRRIITTNDLPDHHTGQFPVSRSDPARIYDANPNSISAQTLTYDLPATPQTTSSNCMGGEVGIMLTGVALFNAFDAGGRDAGAWEVQDTCDGHPQNKGEYHYHTLSRCIADTSVEKVIGFALDGNPITGPKVSESNILTTSDLDECHGITSDIVLDGVRKTAYHYVMTQDFPYSVSCFRGTAIQPPGQHEGRP